MPGRGQWLTRILADLLINLLHIFGLERGTTDDESIEDNTDGPGVNFKAVSVRGVEQYLWCNVVWRATDGLLPLAGTLDKRSQAKVANLDVHVCIEKKVAKLKVTVDDLMCVHIVAGTNEL